MHQIVRQYLLHYGFGDTLRALDQEAGCLGEEESSEYRGAASAPANAGGDEPMAQVPAEEEGAAPMAVDGEAPPANTTPQPSSSAAAAGSLAAGSGDLWALAVRQAARKRIMAWDVDGAVECIRRAGYGQVRGAKWWTVGSLDRSCRRQPSFISA